MMLHRWDRTAGGNSTAGLRDRRSRRQKPHRFRPLLDALEGRVLLSTLVVQNLGDSGKGSLCAELGLAKNGDTIAFASGLKGTLTLASGPLVVATGVNIQGPGANVVTVSGNNTQQVFVVNSGVTAAISGLTIANGVAPASTQSNGGGIDDEGTLTVDQCTFTNNSAPGGNGGAIEGDGALTVTAR